MGSKEKQKSLRFLRRFYVIDLFLQFYLHL